MVTTEAMTNCVTKNISILVRFLITLQQDA